MSCEELIDCLLMQSRWWKDLALAESLSFVRDRLVECYYWMLAVFSEPHYSRARVMTLKLGALTSIMDDIYDNYSTLEESRLLTDAIQRFENFICRILVCIEVLYYFIL